MFCHITPIREVLGSSNVVLSLGKTFNHNYLSTVVLMKRWLRPDMTEKNLDWQGFKMKPNVKLFLNIIFSNLHFSLSLPVDVRDNVFICFIIVTCFFDMILCKSSLTPFHLNILLRLLLTRFIRHVRAGC